MNTAILANSSRSPVAKMTMGRSPAWILILASVLLSSCASNSPMAVVMRENAKGVTDAKACCASLAAVLEAAPVFGGGSMSFGRESRHFDFGEGLAPFFAFVLKSDERIIETQAPLQLLGWAYGGDGAARYVDVELLFYGEGGLPLRAKVLDSSQVFTGFGARSLFSYVEVPVGAKSVVVTTNPARNETHDMGPIRNLPATNLTSRSEHFFSWGGIVPYSYRLSSYGPLMLRALPNQ